MMKIWNEVFLNKKFFYAVGLIVLVFIMSFFYPVLFQVGKLLLVVLLILSTLDIILLYVVKKNLTGSREVNDRLSNFDLNTITITLHNHFPYRIKYRILDELPQQFQIFDFEMKGFLSSKSETVLHYDLKPTERGVYTFGNTHVFAQTPLGIFQRKLVLTTQKSVKVYPSFLRINQYSLQNFKAHINELGQKKIRRIGHSMEFEQIKNYVRGDDLRTVNWKSTAKQSRLMVNQYIDEKSQQVYCAIDKGRVMKMPFNGLTLLDYAINASLVFSNVVLQNHDRAGVFTFSKSIENLVKAERRSQQLSKISESLYNVRSNFMESDFGKLYHSLRIKITQRGLILLFTNFESMDALHRQLPYLLALNRLHLLVVVFFKNTELENFLDSNEIKTDVYEKTIVEKFIYEKHHIVRELQKYGIQTLLTAPENLTVNAINKYLEIKSRGMI